MHAQTPQSLAPMVVQARIDDAQLLPGEALSQSPFSVTVIDAQRHAGAQRLADLVRLDASMSDAYSAVGYWDGVAVRGYVLDNRSNFRREGLPISAETSISLFNKERIEVLKGANGFAAGASVPGGLVNYRVKRPVAGLRSAHARADAFGAASLSMDVSERSAEYGLRVNASAERLSAAQNGTQGSGRHLAGAGLWQLSRQTSVELESEYSLRRQASVPGQSLWGTTLAQPTPRFNLNQQGWSQPVELGGTTTSLRMRHQLGAWQLQAQIQHQALRSHDRALFPFGCSEASGAYFADRFCPGGEADLYDYRSEGERRRVRAAQVSASTRHTWGQVAHRIHVSATQSQVRERYQDQAYNYLGTVPSGALGPLLADPSLTSPNTNRDERSTELALSDAMALNAHTTVWLGTRFSRIERASVRTDASRPSHYRQSLNSPWVAISHRLGSGGMVYASKSAGAESEVVPNRSRYTNAGAALAPLRSTQSELGYKLSHAHHQLGLAWFSIKRPVAADLGLCAGVADCTRNPDGSADHQGFEVSAQTRVSFASGTWRLGGSGTALQARRSASHQAAQNGLVPTNVPQTVWRAQASLIPLAWPLATLEANLSHEGSRHVLPDNSRKLPAWTRIDLTARWQINANVQASVTIDGLGSANGFRESPYQFGHAYLFALPPKNLRMGWSWRM